MSRILQFWDCVAKLRKFMPNDVKKDEVEASDLRKLFTAIVKSKFIETDRSQCTSFWRSRNDKFHFMTSLLVKVRHWGQAQLECV